MLTLLVSLAIFGTIGAVMMRSSPAAGQPSGPNGQGEGHTPVVVCHWVPAHGGSFVIITVDDDGANGNNALQAHLGHPNDIIKPASLAPCVSPAATPPPPTATPSDNGGGHTPVVVCHWVPANGGSFVIITVDDDGADGNNALQAHLGHPNDIINPESLDECESPTATPQPPSATPPDNGGGHTPVVVCHWVPAHGGSFVIITVDDDGADGNNALQAHLGHPNDIISPASLDECVSPAATPQPPTPTSEILPTVIAPTATPEPTEVDPTATPGATVEGPPQAGGGFPMPGGDGQLLIGIISLASLGMGLTGLGYWRRRLGQQS